MRYVSVIRLSLSFSCLNPDWQRASDRATNNSTCPCHTKQKHRSRGQPWPITSHRSHGASRRCGGGSRTESKVPKVGRSEATTTAPSKLYTASIALPLLTSLHPTSRGISTTMPASAIGPVLAVQLCPLSTLIKISMPLHCAALPCTCSGDFLLSCTFVPCASRIDWPGVLHVDPHVEE